MKYLTHLTLILLVLTACTHKDNKNEILTAKFIDEGITTTNCLFKMYADSTYTFDVHEFQEYRHEKNEIFRGRYYSQGDSIIFFPFDFRYLSAATAIIKNDYLEFVGGKMPFKMKILKRQVNDYKGVDTVKYKDYIFFTYDAAFYHVFSGDLTPYDLTNEDLIEIESILKSCTKDSNLNVDLNDYFKQCISIRNKNNEREVWINLLCNPRDVDNLKYFVIQTHDGGDCYFNVKLNLDKGECYDLMINGEA